MSRAVRACALAASLLACVGASAQQAQPAPAAPADAKAAPTDLAPPAEPSPGDTNAQRAKVQPGNNAPFWRGVRESGRQHGYSSLPDPEAGTLIQSFTQYPGSQYATAGEAWRQARNRFILPYGGWFLVIVALAIGLFYWRFGPLGHTPNDGRSGAIERFTYFERAAHWVNASAFVVLAVSGLVMAFGKFVLLPLIGASLYGWLTYALKTVHNFVGPAFAVSLVVVILTFVRDNVPKRDDWRWLAKGGGLLGGHEVPSHRFNAGEKVVFWGGAFGLGLIVVASGLVLDKLLPGIAYERGTMQLANMIHAVATVLMVALFLGHIYIGTIGMRGAYSAMRNGRVNDGWAREHHELWHEDIKAGKIPAQRSRAGAGAGGARPAASA